MADNVNDYLSNGALFSKLSDITRIVDPLQKTVIQYKNKESSKINKNKIKTY